MPPAPTYLTRANAPLPRTRRSVDRDAPSPRLALGRHMLADFAAPQPPFGPRGLI